jgi:hypothetical protein
MGQDFADFTTTNRHCSGRLMHNSNRIARMLVSTHQMLQRRNDTTIISSRAATLPRSYYLIRRASRSASQRSSAAISSDSICADALLDALGLRRRFLVEVRVGQRGIQAACSSSRLAITRQLIEFALLLEAELFLRHRAAGASVLAPLDVHPRVGLPCRRRGVCAHALPVTIAADIFAPLPPPSATMTCVTTLSRNIRSWLTRNTVP